MNAWRELDTILKQEQTPTLIYCPKEGHRLLHGTTKRQFLERLIEKIQKHYPDAEEWTPGTKSRKVILDLVTDDRHRAHKVKFANEHGDRISAILAVGMYREGADWVPAQRVIDFIPSASDQDRLQRFGRIIRDMLGKRHVRYISLYARNVERSTEGQRCDLNNLLSHFQTQLVLGSALYPPPILPPEPEGEELQPADDEPAMMIASPEVSDDGDEAIEAPQSREEVREQIREKEKAKEGSKTVDRFCQLPLEKQFEILRESLFALITVAAAAEATGGKVTGREAIGAIAEQVLRRHLLDRRMAPQILIILRKGRYPDLPTTKLSALGWNQIAEKAVDGIRLLVSGAMGAKTFREIQKLTGGDDEENWIVNYRKVSKLKTEPKYTTSEGRWIKTQKTAAAVNLLLPHRLKLLTALPWFKAATKQGDNWRKKITALQAMTEPPKDGHPLYPFVNNLRNTIRRGKISANRMQDVAAVSWWDSRSKQWQRRFEEIAALKAEPPTKQARLYQWVAHQRAEYQVGELSEAQIAACESISWWNWRADKKLKAWRLKFDELRNLPVMPHSRTQNREYQFVERQRKNRNELTSEQKQLCESLPWWKW